MPLETANFISDLVTSNPAASDGLNSADDHMRLIKGTLKNTFPNFTPKALSSTQEQLDAAVTATSNGIAVLNDAGAFFKTNATDGLTNPATGKISLKLAGSFAADFTNSASINTLRWYGPATFDGAITAPGIIPIGGMMMWLTDTLPTVGKWCWANGGTVSRTGDGAALFALWGTKYGAGDGTTTFNVINMQEVVPVGKSTMGGAASPNLLSSIASGIKTALGSIFGTDTHTLTNAQMPVHNHGGTTGNTQPTASSTATGTAGVGGYSAQGGGTTTAPGNGATGISVSTTVSNHAHSIPNDGGGQPHPNTQPSGIVNFIIRYG